MNAKNILFIGTILILFIFVVSCTQKDTKFVCSGGTIVSDEAQCPKTELHLGLSYCFVQETDKGPINPTTPTGIEAGMKLTSKNGVSEGVKVKYTVRDPVTNEIIKTITNNVGSVSNGYEDKIKADFDLGVFLKEESGVKVMNTRLPINIEVSCTNCRTIGDCPGCTDKGLSFICS